MATILAELFQHNRWANLRLLDACARLTDDQLNAAAPGTYGRVRDTLVHMLAAEERYVGLLTGEQPKKPLRESEGYPGIPELRKRARRSGQALIEVAARARPNRILRGVRRGKPYAISIEVVLVQAINHATEHRAHIVTSLSQHGVTVPDLDGWAFGEREK